MIRLKLVEKPMPTGSKNPDELLAWILDTVGLVRRKSESWREEEVGALHRIMKDAFLMDPLKGWDIKTLGDVCGLSQTGMHHQMVKLRDSGLVSSENYGRWHIYVLRGGSITAAINLLSIQAKGIMELRIGELGDYIEHSEQRMQIVTDRLEVDFVVKVSEPSATKSNMDRLDSLIDDLGLNGDRAKENDDLAKNIFIELSSSFNPITILSIADKFSESRSRVKRTIDRFRSAGIIERVPMLNRIAQDIFIGIMRQFDARGEEWLITRGGLGRIDKEVAETIISNAKSKKLNIEKVEEILKSVPIESQKILLNTLGGRMPYGFRIVGRDGKEVGRVVMTKVDRVLRRLKTVSERLDIALLDD
ncbi:MAG: ArsR/SmtB family transcription factor [Candidatus Poseidoniales archaeon]